MRTPREALIDRVLLLYAIDKVNEYGVMEGPFKLMKVPFVSQLAMNRHKRKGFNYTFFRYMHGPLSTEIYEDANALEKAGFITGAQSKGRIQMTPEGVNLLNSLSDLFSENEHITREIDRAARECAPLSFGQLKRRVYDIEVKYGSGSVPIREIPSYTTVLGNLNREEARDEFKLDEDWLDSIYGIFDMTPEDRQKLRVIRKAS